MGRERPEPEAEMSTRSEGKQGQEGKGCVRVLVVEDEFAVSLALKALAEAAGCEVVGIAHEADSAVELARSLRPDVVLMDIGLPEIDGVEATRQIMAEAPTRVILVTAYADERVGRALKAGARLALRKPIREEQLARAIAEVVSESGSRAGALRSEGE